MRRCQRIRPSAQFLPNPVLGPGTKNVLAFILITVVRCRVCLGPLSEEKTEARGAGETYLDILKQW